jgi:hypothetical protein
MGHQMQQKQFKIKIHQFQELIYTTFNKCTSRLGKIRRMVLLVKLQETRKKILRPHQTEALTKHITFQSQ